MHRQMRICVDYTSQVRRILVDLAMLMNMLLICTYASWKRACRQRLITTSVLKY
jgi:hypothetical protein